MKIKKLILPLILTVSIILSACAELLTTLQSVATTLSLTEAEVVQGLKEALKTGAHNSSGRLAAENGLLFCDPSQPNRILGTIPHTPTVRPLIPINFLLLIVISFF